MNNNSQQAHTYHSLEDIRRRKEEVRGCIHDENEKIKVLWNSLFHKPQTDMPLTPARRWSKWMNTGVGLFDAALLGWKLYRKFAPKRSSRKGWR